MKALKNFKNLLKTLREALIAQSQLLPERILNALSLEGTELDKLLQDSQTEYNSIEQEDTTILFELMALPSSSNVSMEEGDIYTARDLTCNDTTICSDDVICGDFVIDRSITYYKMYRLHLMMYGEDSSYTAAKLAGRFRSQETKSNLYSSDIYIETVSDPDVINEFKNNIMWLRNDLNIDLGVKIQVAQASLPSEYKEINDIHIIRRETI